MKSTAEKNIRRTELACEANNIRRVIQVYQSDLRYWTSRRCKGPLIPAIQASIAKAEERWHSIVSQIEAIR